MASRLHSGTRYLSQRPLAALKSLRDVTPATMKIAGFRYILISRTSILPMKASGGLCECSAQLAKNETGPDGGYLLIVEVHCPAPELP